jgi:perosamine synthetase
MKKFQEILEFIRELYNKPQGFIPLHAPVFKGNEKKYLQECIDTTFVSSVGKFVDQFEEKIAEFTGAKKAVVCVNGTNALHLALMMAGVEQNDEVITQPLTFIATANAIAYCNANPVFIDVDMDTLGMSPESLMDFIENRTIVESGTGKRINKNTGRKIGAVVPMHTYGHPCRIDLIAEICLKYKISLVEDAAESLGSFYKERHTGIFGKIGVLSFNGNKILTTGGGGMLLFNDEELAQKAKHLTTQAKVPHPWEFMHDEIGYNYRMPNINAALGLAQLEQLPGFLENKRKIAEKYRDFFKSTPWRFFTEPENAKSNFWLNVILMKDRKERDEFLKYSNENGVMTRPAWQLMNELPMFKQCETVNLTNVKEIVERLVNIPSSIC